MIDSSDRQILIQHRIVRVRQALEAGDPVPLEELLMIRDLQGQMVPRKPAAGRTPREAAVLILLYPQDDDLWFPLTVRSPHLPQHRGEVSLPGGSVDPEDADLVATALRETHEELGIDPAQIEVIGTMSSFYIPASNFQLTPVVGVTTEAPEIVPNPYEIDSVLHVPLRLLLSGETIIEEEWTLHGMRLIVPFFAIEGYKVWGATALLLSELAARLRRLG
ncbi:MAG: CoA pyrophosphatase [Chloroflexaceae bacterium]|nr:CoA pyrophosphatase [Chloroflexaceae bacterium]NJO06364.1 CoA pyrophosphatase [Chloroflexaceae bacterium]